MADTPSPQPDPNPLLSPPGAFPWQTFFQRSREPLFLLNRNRRILFVNRAWEELTGLTAAQARRQAPAEPGKRAAILRALRPPPEVLRGQLGRARRQISRTEAGRRWWDVDFFPLQNRNGRLRILGRIAVVALDMDAPPVPLPEELVALQSTMPQWYSLDTLSSRLPAMQRVVEQVRLATQTRVPVLLLGEAGTGKHWVARIIHHHGLNRERAFAALDCVHLPAAALSQALFADNGLLRRSDVGTIYLKEPACLPRDLQARLCDWLGNAPAGREDDQRPRLVAGCRSDPAEEVRAGRLLDELHCALATLVIALPPLRERQADLPNLVERMLRRASGIDERAVSGLTAEAWELLRAYSWPGNLGELYGVLVGACRRAQGTQLGETDFPAYLGRTVRLEQAPGPAPPRSLPLDQMLAEAERRLLQLALRLTGNHHTKAAELLAIPRPRLWRRMKALGLVEAEEPPPTLPDTDDEAD